MGYRHSGQSWLKLRNKVVLVTGAAGQLGRALCQAYRTQGARVIGADQDLNKRKIFPGVDYRSMDIADEFSVRKTFDQIHERYKKIDILVNNAGISTFDPFWDRPESSFDRVMDVNLKGTFWCIQHFARHHRRKKSGGSIINIGSIYGVVSPDPGIYTDCSRHSPEVYGASKAGVIQMTKYFAVHLAPYQIRVNCVSPGGIFNPENPQGKDFVKNYSARCPLGRMARTEEIVGPVLFLSSPAAAYATGTNLMVDGGMSAW